MGYTSSEGHGKRKEGVGSSDVLERCKEMVKDAVLVSMT